MRAIRQLAPGGPASLGYETSSRWPSAMRGVVASALVVLVCFTTAWVADEDSATVLWTERQAESIASIRGMPVHDAECRGLGAGEEAEYKRFDCMAGGRAPWQTYDTVAVSYVLHPLAEYDGPRSRHRVTRVRFVGGPGVP